MSEGVAMVPAHLLMCCHLKGWSETYYSDLVHHTNFKHGQKTDNMLTPLHFENCDFSLNGVSVANFIFTPSQKN